MGWVEFYAYLSELPPHSKFKSAISQDPEIARRYVSSLSEEDIREIMEEREVQDDEKRLTPEGYTQELEKLNQIVEEVRILRLGMTGDKNAKFKPQLRPKTEQEVLLEKRMEEYTLADQESMEKAMGF